MIPMATTAIDTRALKINTLLKKIKVDVSYEALIQSIKEDSALDSDFRQQTARLALDNDLDELNRLVISLEENNLFDSLMIADWISVINGQGALHRGLTTNWDKAKKMGKKGYEHLMLGLNVISIALNMTALFHGQSQFASKVILPFGKGKSYSVQKMGVIGGLTEGLKHIKHGDYLVGSANLLAASTTISVSLTALIGTLVTHSLTLAASAALSTIAMVFIQALGSAIELFQAKRSEERIAKLQKIIKTTKNSNEKMQLQKLVLLEIASKEDHVQKAKNYATSAFVMLTVSVIAYLCLSGASFGVLPAATVVIALCGAIFGLIQHLFFKANAKETLKETINMSIDDNQQSITSNVLYIWQQIQNDASSNPKNSVTLSNGKSLSLYQTVTIKQGLLRNRTINLKEYIDDLLVNFPKKGLAIIQALNTKDEQQLVKAMAIKQYRVSIEPTIGSLLIDSLLSDKPQPDTPEAEETMSLSTDPA